MMRPLSRDDSSFECWRCSSCVVFSKHMSGLAADSTYKPGEREKIGGLGRMSVVRNQRGATMRGVWCCGAKRKEPGATFFSATV